MQKRKPPHFNRKTKNLITPALDNQQSNTNFLIYDIPYENPAIAPNQKLAKPCQNPERYQKFTL